MRTLFLILFISGTTVFGDEEHWPARLFPAPPAPSTGIPSSLRPCSTRLRILPNALDLDRFIPVAASSLQARYPGFTDDLLEALDLPDLRRWAAAHPGGTFRELQEYAAQSMLQIQKRVGALQARYAGDVVATRVLGKLRERIVSARSGSKMVSILDFVARDKVTSAHPRFKPILDYLTGPFSAVRGAGGEVLVAVRVKGLVGTGQRLPEVLAVRNLRPRDMGPYDWDLEFDVCFQQGDAVAEVKTLLSPLEHGSPDYVTTLQNMNRRRQVLRDNGSQQKYMLFMLGGLEESAAAGFEAAGYVVHGRRFPDAP